MKFTQNTHPTRLFGPTRLIGTWEYCEFIQLVLIKNIVNLSSKNLLSAKFALSE